MKINVGKCDRSIRVILGLAILGAGLYFKNYWGLIGIIPLFTAYVRWCPVYLPFNFSTENKK